jgi:quercetin dioxygenase-like cupin family protein
MKIESDHADYTSLLLSACPASARRDIYQIVVQPGEAKRSHPHMTGVIEHIILTRGSAMVGLIDQTKKLFAGDYISYPGDLEHIFDALEENTEAIIIMEQG